MLLSDRIRIVLFWFTIGIMLVVAALAGLTILRAFGGLPVEREPSPSIVPSEVSLCTGEAQQFTVQEDLAVVWEASGGTINDQGLFTAGETPGAYSVTATREGSRQGAAAMVNIVACTPTPTATPIPAASPTPLPTATETPSVAPPVDLDPEGDVRVYETGEIVESPPPGVDIRRASVAPDMSIALQPTDDVPAELAAWREEGEALFWISFHDAVPDPPVRTMNWLVVLDVDGNPETGRPVGSRLINPDIGDEVAIGVTYDNTTGEYDPYCLVWQDGAWTSGPETRYIFAESRTVVGLAVSLEALEVALAGAGAAALVPEEARARAAAETYLGDGTRVIDFYPDLPE